MKTLICDCNRTMPIDRPGLTRALSRTPGASADGLQAPYSALCRREAAAFQRAARDSAADGEPLLVGCTQEQRLFLALNDQTEGAASVAERPIRFFNVRETGGWSRDAAAATPKLAALVAAAQAPTPEPVPTVGYRSRGRCLVLGAGPDAERAAALLGDRLDLTLLVEAGEIGQAHDVALQRGRLQRLSGWLGAFRAEWVDDDPIDLDLCTRCNACVVACPEGAIDLGYHVDLARCRSHRDCVRVCEAPGAIDFGRAAEAVAETFDLVLDLRTAPAFPQHQPPQGYFHAPPGDAMALTRSVVELRGAIGEFEKPKFFQYQSRLCAHSRNEQVGCHACIDVCSAAAIRSDASLKGRAQGKAPRTPGAAARPGAGGGGIVVEPHLCVGCGACSTVCPSGALTFAYPGPVDQGRRLRAMLTAYAAAGGRDAVLLLHSEGAGARAIEALGRAASSGAGVHGVPARVVPVPVWHTASVGLDLWLAALAFGAAQVWVLTTDEEAPQYRAALQEQMAVGQTLLSGLGYAGIHLRIVEAARATGLEAVRALDRALQAPTAATVSVAAAFAVQPDKRATLDLALDHLLAQAPAATGPGGLPDAVTLPVAGSPFGTLAVDTERCTLCLSCVGACPQGALIDNPERPELRFIEGKCVQCGLCATTCPEDAIRLQPRLWLAESGQARRRPRTLAETQPFACVRCGKPFGTLRAIENMLSRLSGHAAFQGPAAERLKMCGDCRVVDLYTDPGEVRITDL